MIFRRLFLVCLIFIVGCKNEIEYQPFPIDSFESFWYQMDSYYSHFNVKNIDWDSVYTYSTAELSQTNSDENLKHIFQGICTRLEDQHLMIETDDQVIRADLNQTDSYPLPKSLKSLAPGIDYMIGNNYMYIRLSSFSFDQIEYLKLDSLLSHSMDFNYFDNIFFDLRKNNGGDENNYLLFAPSISDAEAHIYRYIRYRNGPDRLNGFSEPIPSSTIINSSRSPKRIIVLLAKDCVSACEGFALYLKALPNSKVLGANSGGSSGNPVKKVLPNGWFLSHSSWSITKGDGQYLEGSGVAPDYRLDFTDSTTFQNRLDSIISTFN